MYILYILMRNDMTSMNPGKAIAQACHAQALVHEDLRKTDTYKEWMSSADGFGTTIVLGVNGEQLLEYRALVDKLGAFYCFVHDPTYPVPDGFITHLIPMDTCLAIFGWKEDLEPVLEGLTLYK